MSWPEQTPLRPASGERGIGPRSLAQNTPIPSHWEFLLGNARSTSTPRAPIVQNHIHGNGVSRSAGSHVAPGRVHIAFGSAVPKKPDAPRSSFIRTTNIPASNRLREYPTPSGLTPKRQLTVPFTPMASRRPPVGPRPIGIPLAPTLRLPPVAARREIDAREPQQRGREQVRRPMSRIQQQPEWVERLSKPKRIAVPRNDISRSRTPSVSSVERRAGR